MVSAHERIRFKSSVELTFPPINPGMSFGSFNSANSARRTIKGYEAMNMIRKGQIQDGEGKIHGNLLLFWKYTFAVMTIDSLDALKQAVLQATGKLIQDINNPINISHLDRLIIDFNQDIAAKTFEYTGNVNSNGSVPALPAQDYTQVYEIIKSQEKQFVDQLLETRKFASTWLLGTLGGISIVLVQKQDQTLLVDRYLLISLIAIMGALGLCMLWVLDRKVYHRLLNSIILEGLAIENDSSNNIPTKVRTHTLRITGQLGLPIAIFYLFPISFLLFISYSFSLKFLPLVSVVNIGLLITYVLLLLMLFILSFPTPLKDLASNIQDFEAAIESFEDNDVLKENNWLKLTRILQKNEDIRGSVDGDRQEVINKSWLAFILFVAIVFLFSIAIYRDSQQSRLAREQPRWEARQGVIEILTNPGNDYSPLKIEVKAQLNKNICKQLSVPFDVKNINDCKEDEFGDRQVRLDLKLPADTPSDPASYTATNAQINQQLDLLEKILAINGIEATSDRTKVDVGEYPVAIELSS